MIRELTFVTGNPDKAEFAKRYLDIPVNHQKVSGGELQSYDLAEIVEQKARIAYDEIQSPVLVEDTGLVYLAYGRTPGPFIKFSLEDFQNNPELGKTDPRKGLEGLCRMLDGFSDKRARAEVCFGVFDGNNMKLFHGSCSGSIAQMPRGTGWGWDAIFIPEGSDLTWGEMNWDTMNEEELMKWSLRVPVYREIERSLNDGR